MGEQPLWDKFLEEEVTDLQTALTWYGVTGILTQFENWLKANEHIVSEYSSN